LPLRRCHGNIDIASVRRGATWARLCGNGDWAHVVAERFREDRNKGVVLQFTPGTHSVSDILALVSEVVAWLTPEETADFTFSTYCYQSAIGNPVFFRAYTAESPYLASARRLDPHGVIVLGRENSFGADEDRLLRIYRERVRQEEEVAQERAAMEVRIAQKNAPEAARAEAEWGGASISISGHSAEATGTSDDRWNRPLRVEKRPSPVEHQVPPRHGSHLLVAIIVAVVLALLGLAGVIFWPWISAHSPWHEDTSDSSAIDRVSSWATSHGNAKKEDEPAKPTEESLPVEETPSVAATVLPEVVEAVSEATVVSAAESLQFFEDFLLLRKKSIPLPKKFASSGVISVVLSGIGDKSNLPATIGALSVSDTNCCLVFPLEWIDAPNHLEQILVVSKTHPEEQLVLRIADGKLTVQEPPAGDLLPSRDNVMEIRVDDAVLFTREFTFELRKELEASETISGRVDLTADGRLVGILSCSERLRKYQDFVRLEMTVIQGDKSPCRKIPVALKDTEREANILNFGEALEYNRGCRSLSVLRENLSRGRGMREKYFQDVAEGLNTLDKKIQKLGTLYPFLKNKELTIREPKKKPSKIEVKLQETSAQVGNSLASLKEHFQDLCDKNKKVSLGLFSGELTELNRSWQYLSAVRQDMDNPNTKDRENYVLDRQNIQTILDEVAAISDMSQLWLKTRLDIEANLLDSETQLQRAEKEATLAQGALAQKLKGVLSAESYETNFKAQLEGGKFLPIDLETLRNELRNAFTLEFHLEAR